MADSNRRHGFESVGDGDPGGSLTAFAAPPAGQAVLRGRLDDPGFADAAAAALDAALPTAPDMALSAGPLTVFRIGPDSWHAVDETDHAFGPRLETTAGLRALDMTSARSRLRLRGAAVRDLLAVGAAIDLRPSAFPPGAFAQTTVGNATALLHAMPDDAFDAYVARSFAVSWARWLNHARREFGLTIAET